MLPMRLMEYSSFSLQFGGLGFGFPDSLTSDVVENFFVKFQDGLVRFQCRNKFGKPFIDLLSTDVEVLVLIVAEIVTITTSIAPTESTSQNMSADLLLLLKISNF